MRKKLFNSLVCFISSGLFVVILYQVSYKINHRPNGFIRLFPPHMVNPLHVADLNFNSYYIAGASSKNIYLGNYTVPNYLLVFNYSLKDSSSIYLHFPENTKLVKGSSVISVDSPDIFISDGRVPAIYHATFTDLNLVREKHDSTIYFTTAVPFSSSSVILKVYDPVSHESKMAKENFLSSRIKYEPVLEKQAEGLFSTDGTISIAKNTGTITYVYYYRDQFICMDTNLHIKYNGKTIDTISNARIQLAKIRSAGVTTFSAPPLTVNKRSCVFDKWILVHSLLKANNEDEETFDQCSVIDVYARADGKYLFSFYLADYENKKITDLRVLNNIIVGLYDNHLYTWLVNF
jgi:hypothetical protein